MLSIRPHSPHPSSTLRPSSSLDDLHPVVVVKSGYLSKQGGARGGRKSWKRRYFQLKEDCLYYYHSEDDPVLLGVMPLHASQLLDLSESGTEEARPERRDAKVCWECKRGFSLTLRRHHCRRCGHCFCDRCSSKQIALPRMAYRQTVRVCEACYEEERDWQLREQDERSAIVAAGAVSLLTAPPPYSTASSMSTLLGDDDDRDATSTSPQLPVRTIRNFTLPSSHRSNLFAIKNSERELWLQADSTANRREWVAAIRAVQERSNEASNGGGSKSEEGVQWEIDWDQITLIQRVGSGSFGDVYRGRLWGTEIAVKTLRTEELDMDSANEVLDDLKKEVSILSQLRHPNVVLYIGACTSAPHIAICTEWCDRGSLSSILSDHSQHMNCQRMVSVAMGIAQGVNYLHALDRRIVHRDLKSANILVTRDWQLKVSDFGLSHMRQTISSKDGMTIRSPVASAQAALAGDGRKDDEYGIVGTPEYIAPEVMEGLPYTEKIDVYSYGVLLCELITRQPPFHDRYTIHSYMDIVEAVLDDGALPTIPAWSGSLLTPLIMRCLSRDPTARPSFHEIILRLRECEAMKEWEFFAIDLERLREQLEGANAAMQALGASELAVLLRERKVTRVKERACRVVKDRIERDGRSLTESGPGYRVDSISAELSPLPSPALAAAAAPGNRLSATFTLPLSPSVICTPLTSPRESSELQPSAWVLDNAMTQSFLERLTALLSSSFENVQYACCLALHSILSCSSPSSPTSASFHRHDRDLLVSEGAIRLLLSLLTSSNPLVVQHAGEVLLLLTASMSSAEMLQFVGSREAEMEVWTRIVEDDVRRCEREREEMDRALEAKRVHMGEVRLLCAQQRREKHEEAQREERGVSLSHTKPRMQRKRSKATRMSPDSTMSPSPSATPLATATPSISPYTSNPDASTLPPSLSFPVPLSADDRPMAPPAPARPSASSSPSPPLSPKRSHLKHFEYVLRHIESGAAHITLTSAGRRSRGNGKQEEQKEDDSACLSAEQRNTLLAQLSALSSSVACPASFSEYFSSILLSGPALRLERGGGEGWSVCYLVLTVGELRVYGSEKDEPDEARYVMRVKGGVGGNVTAAEVSGLHSLLVDDLGVHTFAFASEAVMKQWKQMMDSCGGDVEEERKEDRDTTDTAAELTAEEEAHCDELFSLLPIVEPSALLAFHAEYSSLSHSSYLVLMPSSSSAAPSAHFFLLSSGTHLYAFPSHTSSPTDSDYHFELDVAAMTAAMFHHVADEHQAMHSALFRLRTKGSMDELRLVAANSVERDRWAHAILPPEALPTAAATAAAAPNSSSSLPASEYSLAPFLSHFGPIDFAGFLHRRRRYSSRWLRQFAVLVGSDLYMYDSPLSSPGESTAACYVCTASGRPFEVVRGEGCVWEVTQPNGGSVVLKAENEKEYEVWRQAIEQSCKRLGDVAAARHRKYTH